MSEGKKTYVRNGFNHMRLNLSAPAVEGAEKRANFGISWYNNDPSFWVRTQKKSDDNEGYARGGMSLVDFRVVLGMLQLIAEGQSAKFSAALYTGKMNDKILAGKLVIGRETDASTGKKDWIYIGLVKPGITAVKYYFEASPYHVFYDENGQEMDKAKVSEHVAKSYALTMADMVTTAAIVNYVDVDYGTRRNDNGGGNYNRSSKGPDSYSGSTVNFDEDLPM